MTECSLLQWPPLLLYLLLKACGGGTQVCVTPHVAVRGACGSELMRGMTPIVVIAEGTCGQACVDRVPTLSLLGVHLAWGCTGKLPPIIIVIVIGGTHSFFFFFFISLCLGVQNPM